MPDPNWPPRWDPFRALEHEMGRVLQSLAPGPAARAARPFPSVNVYEASDRYVLTAELPGMTADQLDLSISGETLTLRGQRVRAEVAPDEAYRRQERAFGSWSRAIGLPGRIDGDKVAASFRHGILTVTLPKADGSAARQIPVLSTSP